MFTGLIKEIGRIKSIRPNASGSFFTIECSKLIKEISIDDSVATNGVCLTATEVHDDSFGVQAVHVSLKKTGLGSLRVGDPVNLELALRPNDRLGGHFVQGHVSGVGEVVDVQKRGDNYEIAFTTQKELFKYMIAEGSVAIDGISLTISELSDSWFKVSVIPHTFKNTILHHKKRGSLVNIEVDMMAKYLERFVNYDVRSARFKDLLYKED